MSHAVLKVDEFVRSIRVNRNSPHALFLGAGASLSSGVPSAGRCIDEWKRDIFVTNNPTLSEHVSEITLSSVMRRIDNWLRQNGSWPADDEDDYSYFIEKCLPIADDRRKFFEPWIRDARPHVGYQLLCSLAEAQIIRSVWTTNFDSLTSRACASTSITPIEIGVDCQHRVYRQPSRTELVCVSLHGDYRYDPLANTAAELQEQEEHLKKSLAETLKSESLIVCGYSGRDKSVMTALKAALTAGEAVTKLYWCGYDDEPCSSVAELLSKAKEAGRDAFYVPGVDFDDLMSRVATSCISGDASKQVLGIIGSAGDKELPMRQPFDSFDGNLTGLIKSNAFPLHCPSEMFAFDLTEWPKRRVWKWLAERALPHNVLAVPFKKVLAFGTLDGINAAFEGSIEGQVQRVPISEKDYRYEDGAVMSLLQQALVRAIAGKEELDSDGKRLIWEPLSFKSKQLNGKSYRVHRCIGLGIRSVGERLYLTMDPTYYVPASTEADQNDARTVQKGLLGYQHNKEYNDELNYWRKKLGGGTVGSVLRLSSWYGSLRVQSESKTRICHYCLDWKSHHAA